MNISFQSWAFSVFAKFTLAAVSKCTRLNGWDVLAQANGGDCPIYKFMKGDGGL